MSADNKHKVGDIVWIHNSGDYISKGKIVFCSASIVIVVSEFDYNIRTNPTDAFKSFDDAKLALLSYHNNCAQRHLKLATTVMGLQEPQSEQPVPLKED